MAQNTTVSAIVPQKLRGRDNYKDWSLFMKNFLLSQEVWVIIEPGFTCNFTFNYPDQEQKKNATALHAILITCETDVYSLIEQVESARDAWNILADSYGVITPTVTSLIVPKKLRGQVDYKEWRYRMKKILSSRGVWDIVEHPAGGRPDDSPDDRSKRDVTALHAIQINCESVAFSAIRNASTAEEAWRTLRTLYGGPILLPHTIPINEIVAEKLRGGENYREWSLLMKNFLLSQGVWDVTQADPQPRVRDWEERNKNALKAIKETCEREVRVWIRNANKAVDAWNILTVSYAEPDASNDEQTLNNLFKYAKKGDWGSIAALLTHDPNILARKFGSRGFTILHVAALAGNVWFVTELVNRMEREALEEKENRFELTALHYVAVRGIKQMAKHMIGKNNKLVEIPNIASSLPLTLACKYRHREMTKYLYQVTSLDVLCQGDVKYGSLFIKACITSRMLDLAVKALDDDELHKRLVAAKDPKTGNNSLLENLCRAPRIFPSSQFQNQLQWWERLIYLCIPKPHVPDADGRSQCQFPCKSCCSIVCKMILEIFGMTQIYDLKMRHAYSSALLDRLWRYLDGLVTVRDYYELGIERAFDIAVKFGVVEIIKKLVEFCPLLLDRRDKDNRDLIMQSIVNRNEKVFSLYYELKDSYAATIKVPDKYGNTLLHLAGKPSPPSVLALLPGAALQMQRELQWFKEVESIVDPGDKLAVNETGEKPEELFSKSHKELVKEGEQWMKNTASSYTVVGALIITVVFAAAFTIPGGTDKGIPFFLHKKAFKVFILSDAISLFAASTSVLMFLGILTSRYEEQDFLFSLPKRLIIGLSTLFISIAAMTVAFCAAFIVVLNGMLEIIVPIIVLACIPIILFFILQFPLLFDLIRSTYVPGIFDRKRKPCLWRLLDFVWSGVARLCQLK